MAIFCFSMELLIVVLWITLILDYHNGVLNHQRLDWLLKRLKKTSQLRWPENVSIWWRHHEAEEKREFIEY